MGPSGCGKTTLLNILGLLDMSIEGEYLLSGKSIESLSGRRKARIRSEQIGFVFQDSILFNLTLRENIAFSNTVKDEDLAQAIATAELSDFVDTLPEKLDTIVSERVTSLSGGQKQRVMLARALALRPNVLLLDDFTARMDARTERRILDNVQKNYPDITLVSVTQKIAPVEGYDQILLLMEGELLAKGTHTELMEGCPEYVQIYESQHSTHSYELQAE
jgi:ATP-binding cassette subfamily B protein